MYRIDEQHIEPKNVGSRLTALTRLGQVIFHAGDLASLWQIKNPNTLHTTLHRYVQKGLLKRIYKGMYALKPLHELDPYLLGLKVLHRFSYVSTETVLTAQGLMLQKIHAITLVSDISKQFSIGPHHYRCRKLSDRYLHNPAGIGTLGGVPTATVERALADLLYFNPRAYLDGAPRINWQKVRRLQKEIGYPIPYDSSQSQRRRA